MAVFRIRIAGQVMEVQSLFDSTRDYCRAYLTEEEPHAYAAVRPEDLVFEQAVLDQEAREEGLKRRKFYDPFLERTAIQRKMADHLLTQNTLLLHSSTVAVDGKAYLFTAKCGTGKSTHTRLWREAFGDRAVMVNDDKPFLRMTGEGVLACGAPWSGKHGLDSNITVPLQGICILERGETNVISPLSPAEALPMLLHQAYESADPALQSLSRELTHRLAATVPLWHMTCTKDPSAAIVAHTAMSANSHRRVLQNNTL